MQLHQVLILTSLSIPFLLCLQFGQQNSEIINTGYLYFFQIIFGAGRHGIVYVWDIRGGRASATFLSHKEVISVLKCFYLTNMFYNSENK